MDELELIRRVSEGDTEAFGHLIRQYHRRLYYFICGTVPDETEAEDLVQKTFVTAHTRLAEFDPRASFISWLRGIALNHCRNEWRRIGREARLKDRLLEARRAELEERSLEEFTAQEPRRAEALRKCLEGLSSSEQEMIRLRFIDALSLKSIADTLKKTSEGARLWLFRLRRRLLLCVKKRLSLEEILP
jgi:RNA polymerase sigma-70 factor (ECF subfamily)